MSGAKHRQKGDRAEREIVDLHKAMGVYAERYPLSGASRFSGPVMTSIIYALGREAGPLVAEVKARKMAKALSRRWLGEYDILLLRRNHAESLVVLPTTSALEGAA